MDITLSWRERVFCKLPIIKNDPLDLVMVDSDTIILWHITTISIRKKKQNKNKQTNLKMSFIGL